MTPGLWITIIICGTVIIVACIVGATIRSVVRSTMEIPKKAIEAGAQAMGDRDIEGK